jgi:hypothetical protein
MMCRLYHHAHKVLLTGRIAPLWLNGTDTLATVAQGIWPNLLKINALDLVQALQ